MPAWRNFEEHVQSVYTQLLNLHDDGIMVARDVRLKGRDGQDHQIDVYYEFEKAGIRHRVAIECKCWNSAVSIKEVKVLKATIDDVVGLQGVIVAACGFQSGARKFASDNGIIALEANNLPRVGDLLAARLRVVALPDEKTFGEPFWTLYETMNGELTGSPFGETHGDDVVGILFWSKKQASDFLASRTDRAKWCVRGLPQNVLRTYILTIDAFAGKFALAARQPDNGWVAIGIDRADLIDEFYVASNPIPAEQFVMPSARRRR